MKPIMRRRVSICEIAISILLCAPAFAGSTGQSALHMPQGSDAGTSNGDYVSDGDGLNTFYRYFIEVPPGLDRLVVEIFDADVGRGGNGEDDAGRDRDRGGGWSTQTDYSLIRPNGTTAATLNNCDDDSCTNNGWQTLLNSTSAQNTAAGHWELRINMDGGNDINAIGIRAHDGTSGSGGTELNVYADSMVSLGVNPDPGANSRSYIMYPYVTSGCACSQNDFDRDSNNGNIGSVEYTSRSGAFTQTLASATLSDDNDWNHDTLNRFTSDDTADDYGIWTLEPTINTYNNGAVNGNYETTYVGSYLAPASDPTANPITSGGDPATFRIYLPTDAGDAPVKPYLEQFLTHNRNFAGTNPPTIGSQSVFTVTVRFTNPTPYAVTFSTSNLITANVPLGVTYGGGAAVSQGTITAQPTVGGTGNITWNPGTVAAGATVLLSYNVRVTPTSNARIIVTATPASGNGTRARFVDETGNTTQARATYTMGGLCELAVQAGLLTEAMVASFATDVRGGGTNIAFRTASEAGTVGFNVYRADGSKVNDALIPASLQAHGGSYQLFDRDNRDANATYIVEEVTASGRRQRYGPFQHLEGIDREQKQQRRDARRMAAEAVVPMQIATDAAEDKVQAAMIGVRQSGIVRVAATTLANALGTTLAKVQKGLEKGKLNITDNGTQVAWQTDGQNLYFFGQPSASIYSYDRVYRVELENGLRMQSVTVSAASAPVSVFEATQELEQDLLPATVVPVDPDGDFWFWEAVISGDPSWGIKTFHVDVPDVASAGGAKLSVRLQGAFKGTTHRANVSMNGVPIGEATWSSFDANITTLNLPGAVLQDGANEITIEGVLENDPVDIFYVDGFTLTYQKYARPRSGQVEVRANGSVGAGPFTTNPFVLDITNRLRPRQLAGASFTNGIAALNAPSNVEDLLFVQTFLAPSFVRASAELKPKPKRADWVIIAPAAFRSGAESLASQRSRDGLATMVVDLERIYDEFSAGNLTPYAIRDFIQSTRTWTKAPKYFVLAGTGSLDYRGILLPSGPMPPLLTATADGLYASDSLFADRNGDRLPDVAIGRIPVNTNEELAAYASKLDRNDRIDASESPLVFAADAADQGADFRASSAESESALASRPATRIYLDQLGGAARTHLLDAWHNGTPLMSWVGHGGLDQMSNAGVLSSYDAPELTSSGRLPVVVAMTCTINRFENGFIDPLGVALTNADDAGAVAVWSASGLSQYTQASEIQRTFMRLAASQPDSRVGDLVVASLQQFPGDTSSIYLLLGDPAVTLALPDEVNANEGTASEPGE
jgi:hypothetical protein